MACEAGALALADLAPLVDAWCPAALQLLVGRAVDNCWSPWAYALQYFGLTSASTGAGMVVDADPTATPPWKGRLMMWSLIVGAAAADKTPQRAHWQHVTCVSIEAVARVMEVYTAVWGAGEAARTGCDAPKTRVDAPAAPVPKHASPGARPTPAPDRLLIAPVRHGKPARPGRRAARPLQSATSYIL